MARMIPDADPAQLEHSSEEAVYRALRDGLGDDFQVLHSYPWLRPLRSEGALSEGEADFVILHPAHGMLVLEVKGGDRIRYDGRRWLRDTKQGPTEFRDPFRQAQRNLHALVDIVQERSGNRVKKGDFVYGYAVVFPHSDYHGEPPPHADRAIVISRRSLPFVDQAVMTAFRAWTRSRRELAQDRFVTMLDCLMPKFGVFRPVGPDIASDVEQLIELTEIQAQVFEGLYEHDRVLVEGVAGSGKTFLALQRAIAFARCGRRTLFVCFNRALAQWLRRQVVDDPRTSEYRTLLTVNNFHALALELAEEADLNIEGGRGQKEFWDETVPELLEQAVLVLDDRGTEVTFDALVVDEAQDFAPKWWYTLVQYLLSSGDAPLYAFLDPNQSLRGTVRRPPLRLENTFRLKTNCRNTRRIAATSASVLDLEPAFFARAPVGIKPRLCRAGTMGHQKGLVLHELRRLLEHEGVKPRQVVLMAPSAKAKGSLADVAEVDGVPLVTDVDAWQDGSGILVTTARSFKGLESDVVVLYDMSEFGPLFRREDLYVACTRARGVLVAVVVHGTTCCSVLESSLAASEAQS